MAPKNQRAEEEELSDAQDSSRSSTPGDSGHKRMRIEKSISVGPSRNARRFTSLGSQDEHQVGSIIRVNLKNFVTYDSVEFYPGPNLNMIIGPNGTGKSTIVCAIALGLGWNTSLLGRAREISDFVKHGQERASIEIELKSKKAVVITRSINKSKNTSLWKLNGEKATHKDIVSKVSSLNIQVDNLCQFLPQDKVSEFAQLSPPELLVQTQKAVGEKEMTKWHEQLIKLREEERSLLSSNKEEEEQVENLEKRNAVLERDVARFREREAILRKIELYELAIPWARYYIAKNKYDELKRLRNENHVAYQKLLKENEPMNEMKSGLEEIEKNTFNNKKLCMEHFLKIKRQLEDALTKLEKLGNDCDDIRRNLTNIKKKEKQRESRITQYRTEIAALEEMTSIQPTENDTSEIKSKIEDLSIRMRKIQHDGGNVKEKLERLDDESREIQRQIDRIDRKRKELEDIKERRLDGLRYSDPDTIDAVRWLRQNRDKLAAHIFYPLCVEINVKDVQYANIIENVIGQNYKTFVCEDEQDYHTMTKELCDIRKMRINVVCFSNTSLNNFSPPMSCDRLKEFGFDCYLLDLIEAPATLLNALCNLTHLYKIPVALQAANVNHGNIEKTRMFNRYYAGDTSYSLSWSRYGKKLAQNFTIRLRPAKIFKDSVNVEQRRELEQKYHELQAALTKIHNNSQELIKEEEKYRAAYEKFREERNVLNEQKRQLLQATTEYQRNKIKLDSKRDQLQRLLDSPDSIKDEEDELKTNLCDIAEKRAGAVIKFQKLLEESIDLFNRRNKATLKYIQASSNLIALETQTQQMDDALRQAQINFNEADRKFNQAKTEAKNLYDECQSNAQSDKMQEITEFSQNLTLEELEDAATAERTKAEMHYAVDSRVIELYDKRKAEIDSLRSRLAFKATRLSKLTSDMTSIREKWEPKLNELIKEISNTFSNAFDRIGCAGEVRVSTHEDYDKWGIEILVKFRDNEKLQILNGQRQSGGERSVSTIMYLMSLQELATAPFRVVDEINQGMDPRNERLVHGQIVQTACRPNTSQYFLITPKLLPDLDYHERMKILCIYNGEWQPEKMDWHKYIKNRKSK